MTKSKHDIDRSNDRKKSYRWLISGGCGFIGTSLVGYLLDKKIAGHIRVIDDLSVGTLEDLETVCRLNQVSLLQTDETSEGRKIKNGGVELFVGDIRDAKVTEIACRDADVVVHLAACTGVAPSVEDPRKDMMNNVIGTFNMLEASRLNGVDHFIFASSGAPIGETDPPIHEKIAPKPVSPYGASKLAGEGYCSAYCRTFGLKTVALRFGNVYGPRSSKKESVIARFVKRALSGYALEIYGDGTQTRDFVYIDDLLEAVCCAAQSNIGGEVFQIATHKETTINEIAKLIKIIMKNKMPELDIVVDYQGARVGDVKRNYSDTSKAKSILGWTSKWSLEDGLDRTVEWFLNNQ